MAKTQSNTANYHLVLPAEGQDNRSKGSEQGKSGGLVVSATRAGGGVGGKQTRKEPAGPQVVNSAPNLRATEAASLSRYRTAERDIARRMRTGEISTAQGASEYRTLSSKRRRRGG